MSVKLSSLVSWACRPIFSRLRPRLAPGKGAAGAGFGHRDADHRLSGDDTWQPALLLFGCGQVGEVGQDDVVLQRQGDRLGRSADPLKLFDDDRVVAKVVDTRPAELLRHRKTKQSKLSCLDEQGTVQRAGFLPLLVGRDHRLFNEVVDQLAELMMLGGVFQACAHCRYSCQRKASRPVIAWPRMS